MQTVADIRKKLMIKRIEKDYVMDKTGVKTIELLGESFIADKDYIVRRPNLSQRVVIR